MRKRLVKLTLLGAAGLALGVAGFALAGTSTLTLTNVGPEPETLTVPWGETLRITNADTVSHSILSSHSELQTGVLLPGHTFTSTITGPEHSFSFRQTGGRGFPGKVEVDFTGRISFASSLTAVDFGRAVRFSGKTTVRATPVELQVHRRGDTRWTTLTTVFSNGSGDYSATVRLERGGKLRAAVASGQIRSAITIVAVRPRLTASQRGAGLTGRIRPAGAAMRLTLECRIGPGRWKRVASKRPSRAGVVSFPVRRGRGVARVALTHRDAKDGYATQASRAVSAAC